MRSSVKVKLTDRAVKSPSTLWSFWVTSSVGEKKSVLDYPPRRGKEETPWGQRLSCSCLYNEELKQDLGSACTQGGSPWICSCWWGGREPFLPTGGTRGQGWSSFAKKGTRVSWQKAEGCPNLCVHFQKHLTLDQILSAVLKLGQWMGNAYWPGWLEAPTEGAGTQPGASLQLARLAFCHGQRERVKIPILRALQKLLLINHLFWSFCLLEFFTQMGNEWWWCRASKNE